MNKPKWYYLVKKVRQIKMNTVGYPLHVKSKKPNSNKQIRMVVEAVSMRGKWVKRVKRYKFLVINKFWECKVQHSDKEKSSPNILTKRPTLHYTKN